MAYERHSKTTNSDCPSSQEPRITGNSGNTGNGLAERGLQPLPPYKKSGNNWQHTPHFQHKSPALSLHLVITVAGKKTVATVWQHRKRLEATVYGAVAIVAAVAGVFEITGTLDYQRSARGDGMSLLSGLLSQRPAPLSTPADMQSQNQPRSLSAQPAEAARQLETLDTQVRHAHWRVMLSGKAVCSMIGAPMTEAQALEEVRHRWPSAEVMHPQDHAQEPSHGH